MRNEGMEEIAKCLSCELPNCINCLASVSPESRIKEYAKRIERGAKAPKRSRRKKPLICVSPDGTERRFDSADQAGEKMHFHPASIRNAISLNKLLGGYRWRYEE